MINFNYPWEEKKKKFSPKGYVDSWELAKAAMYCPPVLQARRMLGLGSEELAKLLDVPVQNVWNWESGRGGPSVEQKIVIKKLLELDGEKIHPLILQTKLGLSDKQVMKVLNASEKDLLSWRQGSYSIDVKQKVLIKKALEFGKAKGLIKD